MKTIAKFIGKVIKVAGLIFVYLLAKGLIMTLLDGWLMLIAYILLVATTLVLFTNKVKKSLRKESK